MTLAARQKEILILKDNTRMGVSVVNDFQIFDVDDGWSQ